jgi:hypothetical protein
MQRQKVTPKIEAEEAAHNPEVEVAHRPEIPRIVDRVEEFLGEVGSGNPGRPTQAVQLIAAEVTPGGATIGDKEQ